MNNKVKEKNFLLRRLVAALFFVAGFLFFISADQVRAVDGVMNGKTVTGETDNYLFWLQTYDPATSPYFFDKFFVDKTGNVGIGLTNPGYKLDVNGVGNFNSNQIHGVATPGTGSDAANKTYVDSVVNPGSGQSGYWTLNGANLYNNAGTNVGIGTTGPAKTLEVQAPSTAGAVTALNLLNPNTSTGAGVSIFMGQSNAYSDYGSLITSTKIGVSNGTTLQLQTHTDTTGVYNTGLSIDKLGNVGIGTTAPGAKLEIMTTATNSLFDALVLSNNYANDVNTGVGLYFAPNGAGYTSARTAAIKSYQDVAGNYADLRFYTSPGGTVQERLRITSAGNIGIGTTNPGATLDVNGSIYPTTNLAGSLGSGTKYWSSSYINGINLGNGSITGVYQIRSYSTDLPFYIANSEMMRLSAAGNLGIGLTNPAYKLDVAGVGNFGSNQVHNVATPGTGSDAANKTYVDSVVNPGSGQSGYWTLNGTNLYNNAGTNVGIGTTNPSGQLDVGYGTNGNTVGDLVVDKTGSGTIFIGRQSPTSGDNTTLIFRDRLNNIKSRWENAGSGSIGFGNFSDGWGVKIQTGAISGAIGNIGSLFKVDSTGFASPTAVFMGGNVGIGTTAPGGRLQVNADNTHRVIITDGTVAGNIWPVSGEFDISTETNHPINFLTNQQYRMTIKNDGNVGINTTNPGYKLDVNGVGNFGSNQIHSVATPGTGSDAANKTYVDSVVNPGSGQSGYWTLNGANLYNNAGTNVGIGTTAPGYKLDVNGNTVIRNTLSILGRNDIYFGNADDGAGLRWVLRTNTTAESGSNVGSDFEFIRRSDTGTSLGTAMVLQRSTGNVGIGTTNPGAKLDVKGTYELKISTEQGVQGEIPAGISYYGQGNSMSIIGDGAGTNGNKLTLNYYNGSSWLSGLDLANVASGYGNLLLMKSGGNVGIGATGPRGKLDVAWSGTDTGNIYFGDWTNGWSFGENVDASMRIYKTSNGTTLTPLVTILNGGNVGINTTNPGYKLDVNGVGNFNSNQIHGVATPGTGTDAANKTYVDSAISSGSVTNADTVDNYHASGAANYVTKFNSSNNTLSSSLLYDNGTNVGVGTTAPGQKLDVAGHLLVNTGGGVNQNYRDVYIGGIGGWSAGETHSINFVYNTDSSPTVFNSINSVFDGTNANLNFVNDYNSVNSILYLKGTGNVGIGLTNPGYKLDVNGVGNFNSNQIHGVATPGTGTDAANKTYVDSTVSGATNYWTLNAANLYNNSGTNVGIGTTAPGYPLHVATTDATNNGVSNILNLVHLTSGTPAAGIGTGISFRTARSSGGTEITSGEIQSIWTDVSGSGVSDMAFKTRKSDGTFNEVMRVTGPGNVGIGATGPRGKLDVAWSGTDTGNIYFGDWTNGWSFGENVDASMRIYKTSNGTTLTPLVTILNGGNVGIGLTNPAYKLDVAGVGNFGSNQVHNVATPGTGSDAANKTYVDSVVNPGSGQSGYWTLNGANLYNNAGTNVGIGTTNPGYLLHIKKDQNASTDFTIENATNDTNARSLVRAGVPGGSTYFGSAQSNYTAVSDFTSSGFIGSDGSLTNGFVIRTGAGGIRFNPGGAEAMRIANTGNVGIGLTNPSQKLEVSGTIKKQNRTMGSKQIQISSSWTTVLTITMAAHTSATVNLSYGGNDWSSHSATNYRAQYIVRDGSGGYGDPGSIISEFNDTGTGNDYIQGQIVNAGSNIYYIQLKTNDGGDGFVGGNSTPNFPLEYDIDGVYSAAS